MVGRATRCSARLRPTTTSTTSAPEPSSHGIAEPDGCGADEDSERCASAAEAALAEEEEEEEEDDDDDEADRAPRRRSLAGRGVTPAPKSGRSAAPPAAPPDAVFDGVPATRLV